MIEAVRTSETLVDNHFTRQYNPEDSSEHHSFKSLVVLDSKDFINAILKVLNFSIQHNIITRKKAKVHNDL
jgi:hypothetical protein